MEVYKLPKRCHVGMYNYITLRLVGDIFIKISLCRIGTFKTGRTT